MDSPSEDATVVERYLADRHSRDRGTKCPPHPNLDLAVSDFDV